MPHHPHAPRRRTAIAVIAASLVAFPVAATTLASGPPLRTSRFVAVDDEAAAMRTLYLRDGPMLVAAAPSVGPARWVPIGLRDLDPFRPDAWGAVRERSAGGASWIEIRGETVLAGFGRADGSGGLLAVSPAGVEVLLDSGPRPFALVEGGATLAPGGTFLALAVRDDDGVPAPASPRVIVVDLRAASPLLHAVTLPVGAGMLEPTSLALTAGTLVAATRDGDGTWWIHRLALPRGDAVAPLVAERVAGPFAAVSTPFARSRSALAFLASAAGGLFDVHVLSASGAAVNVTLSPGVYLENAAHAHHLAIDDDGAHVAYSLRLGHETEVFLHDVAAPGPEGRFHITADARFNAYLDQESFIILGRSALYFDAEHDAISADVYRLALDSPANSIFNLTATGSATQPFLKGTLSLRDVVVTGETVLVSAVGFPEVGAGVQAYSTEGFDSSPVLAAAEAGDFVAVAGELYFHARTEGGPWSVWRVRSESAPASARIENLAGFGTSGARPRFLLVTPDRAYDFLPGAGVLELGPAVEPRVLLASSRTFVTAALAASGNALVLEALGAAGPEQLTVAIATGDLLEVLAMPHATALVPAGPAGALFQRGDANRDGEIDLGDALATLFYAFDERPLLSCLDAADADDNGAIEITDAVHTLAFLFGSGPLLPAPFPDTGTDPTADGLDCAGLGPVN